MQTPKLKPLDDFEKDLRTLREHGWRCPKCQQPFARLKLVYLSRHAIEFGVQCVGQGQVVTARLPWCPKCEREPDTYGCVHEPMFAGTRKYIRAPGRCDFCMEPNTQIEKQIRAHSFIEARMPGGERVVDAGIWSACRSCSMLIEAKQFAALVEVGTRGTLKMHPEIPPQAEPLMRARVRAIYAAVFGPKMDFDGPTSN
jgi:hypothetical protein